MMRYLIILLIFGSQISCSKEKDPEDTKPIVSAVYTNISYGSDALQVMDVYLPEKRNVKTTKTIVVIHGGGWVGGDKTEMTILIDSLQKRMKNYAFINLNYRLAVNNSINVFPSQENDVKSGIEFYLSKSGEYLVSKDLVVLGGSAGGHLALLHSYKNDPEKHVKAVVDFFGPSNLVAAWNDGLIQQLVLIGAIGKTYDQDPQIYIQSSPVNFITAQTPPTIALQGGQDFVVLPAQSQILINKLNSAGVSNQLVLYPADGHGFSGPNTIDAYNKVQSFIEQHVR